MQLDCFRRRQSNTPKSLLLLSLHIISPLSSLSHSKPRVALFAMDDLAVEVLEIILAQLPTKDLLFAQAVSSTCRSVIVKSLTLQRKLFLQPTPGPYDGWKATCNPQLDDDENWTQNYELKAVQVQTVRPSSYWNAGSRNFVLNPNHYFLDRPYREKTYVRATLNPFFWRSEDPSAYRNRTSPYRDRRSPHLYREDQDRTCTLGDLIESTTNFNTPHNETSRHTSWIQYRSKLLQSDPSASWRRMFLTQPPVLGIWNLPIADDGGDDLSPDFGRRRYHPAITETNSIPICMEYFIEDHEGVEGDRKVGYRFALESVMCPGPEHEKLLEKALKGGNLAE